MNADFRAMQWQAIERTFTKLRLSLGTAYPLAVMVRVKDESAVAAVRGELATAGLEVVNVEKAWWPFGRRWSIAARGKALPISRDSIEPWLDAVEAKLRPHQAVIATWVPLLPATDRQKP